MANPNIAELGRKKPSELTKEKIKLGSMKAGIIKTEAHYQAKLAEKRKAIAEQEARVAELESQQCTAN